MNEFLGNFGNTISELEEIALFGDTTSELEEIALFAGNGGDNDFVRSPSSQMPRSEAALRDLAAYVTSLGGSPDLLKDWTVKEYTLKHKRRYNYFDPSLKKFRSRMGVARHLGIYNNATTTTTTTTASTTTTTTALTTTTTTAPTKYAKVSTRPTTRASAPLKTPAPPPANQLASGATSTNNSTEPQLALSSNSSRFSVGNTPPPSKFTRRLKTLTDVDMGQRVGTRVAFLSNGVEHTGEVTARVPKSSGWSYAVRFQDQGLTFGGTFTNNAVNNFNPSSLIALPKAEIPTFTYLKDILKKDRHSVRVSATWDGDDKEYFGNVSYESQLSGSYLCEWDDGFERYRLSASKLKLVWEEDGQLMRRKPETKTKTKTKRKRKTKTKKTTVTMTSSALANKKQKTNSYRGGPPKIDVDFVERLASRDDTRAFQVAALAAKHTDNLSGLLTGEKTYLMTLSAPENRDISFSLVEFTKGAPAPVPLSIETAYNSAPSHLKRIFNKKVLGDLCRVILDSVDDLLHVVPSSTPFPDHNILLKHGIEEVFNDAEGIFSHDHGSADDDNMACIVFKSGETKIRFVCNQYKTGATWEHIDNVCQRTLQSAMLAENETITFLIDFARSPAVFRGIVSQA